MIIAWVLSLIVIIATAIGHLEQSTALHIRLLELEQGAHTAFVAAEKNLNQCESQLQATTASSVITPHDSNTECELILVDANTAGELIRVRAAGNAKPTYSTTLNRIQTKQTQLESMIYRNKQDHTLERLSWRVLWSGAQSDQRSSH
jgi:hypothetical protein